MKMVKIKTADLIGVQLDWAVHQIEKDGWDVEINTGNGELVAILPDGWSAAAASYSTDWMHGGPIIDRESIGTERTDSGDCWGAWIFNCAQDGELPEAKGPTPLIAAMRAFVASNLGGEVEVPEVTQ